MLKIFRNKKEDKLNDLLIEFLEGNGMQKYLNEQARLVAEIQQSNNQKHQDKLLNEKFDYYEDCVANDLPLTDEQKEEHRYFGFLIRRRGLNVD